MKRSAECERIEGLLPLYIDGRLSGDEIKALNVHLAACAGCARSLETYMALENTLSSMPGILPDTRAVASKVSDRLGLERRGVVGGIFSRLSLVWTFAVATTALILFVGHFDYVSALMSGQESLVDSAGRTMSYWIATSSGAIAGILGHISASLASDPWIFLICMTGFGLLIFAAGMFAALKTMQ
jgi:anti-sigma factor RsiW